jgi:DNA-binding transcriptional MerR regulator
MSEKYYSIGDVSRETGVSIKKIRYWQSKGYIKDDRVICGKRAYRYFSKADLKHIKAIKILVDRGYTLAFASKLSRQDQIQNNKE